MWLKTPSSSTVVSIPTNASSVLKHQERLDTLPLRALPNKRDGIATQSPQSVGRYLSRTSWSLQEFYGECHQAWLLLGGHLIETQNHGLLAALVTAWAPQDRPCPDALQCSLSDYNLSTYLINAFSGVGYSLSSKDYFRIARQSESDHR
jgi:hypothetical protein